MAEGFPEPLIDDEVVQTSLFQAKFEFSFGTVHRDAIVDAPNIRLPPGPTSPASASSPRATLWRWPRSPRCPGSSSRYGRAFVVATGGVEVPRLLLAPNDVRTAGLGNDHDLVGRHFVDHLVVPAGFATLVAPPDALSGTTRRASSTRSRAPTR